MSQRQERIADLLQRELSDIIRRDVRDPRVGLASVSSLKVGRDLGHAKVQISVLEDDEDARQEAIDALTHARGYIRSLLARRVSHLRTVPQLSFHLDRGAEHSQRINELLESLHDDRSEDDGDAPS